MSIGFNWAKVRGETLVFGMDFDENQNQSSKRMIIKWIFRKGNQRRSKFHQLEIFERK